MLKRYYVREEDERRALIKILLETFPYPYQTWNRMRTDQLWAAYFKSQERAARLEASDPDEDEDLRYLYPDDENYRPQRIRENGMDMILTDSGDYVEIYD